jgi:diguanylate cyclase (GGDEF)-like protein
MLSNQSIITSLLPALIAGLMATLINWRIHRDMDGVAWWPIGSGVTAIGAVLRTFEVFGPGVATLAAGNSLIIGGQFLVLYGLCRFAGTPLFTRTSVTILAVAVIGTSYFTLMAPHEVARTTIFSLALASTFLLQGPALVHLGRTEGLTGVLVLGGVYIISVIVLIVRIAYLALYGTLPNLDFTSESLSQPAQINQIAAFTYGTALVTLRAYGYILLATARVQLRLKQTATVDDLTGLPNRRAFEEEMRRIAPRVRRDGISFGLAVMDIDHFKRINDTYGHAAGDAMLRHFAVAVRKVLRDTDFFARTGGEEFVLVVTDTSVAALRQAAERIRHALEEAPLALPSGTVSATISAGVAVSLAEEVDYQPVYSRADMALYRAKANGRNCIETAL